MIPNGKNIYYELKEKIEELIVIAPYNTNDRMNEYTYSYDSSYGFGNI